MQIRILVAATLFTFLPLAFQAQSQSEGKPYTVKGEDVWEMKLFFVGDIMGHGSQITSAAVVTNQEYDYSPCFEYLAPIIEKANLAVGNLELTLPGKPPYSGYPQFRSPDELGLALRYAGFDLLVTANNHSNDAGLTGVINTIKKLDDYGFWHTGTFQNLEERKAFYPLVVYKDNFKLAFLNYTYGTNGIPTKEPSIVNLLDEKQIEADIKEAKALQPDMIIVITHWDDEYQRRENESQRALAKKIHAWGADLIIGAHPHVIQPIFEKHILRPGDADSTKQVVAYSLGNFISAQNKAHTDGGIAVEVTLQKSPQGGRAIIHDYAFIPVWRYIQKLPNGKTIFRTIPVSVFENDATNVLQMSSTDKLAMKTFAENTRKHLKAFGAKEKVYTFEEVMDALKKE